MKHCNEHRPSTSLIQIPGSVKRLARGLPVACMTLLAPCFAFASGFDELESYALTFLKGIPVFILLAMTTRALGKTASFCASPDGGISLVRIEIIARILLAIAVPPAFITLLYALSSSPPCAETVIIVSCLFGIPLAFYSMRVLISLLRALAKADNHCKDHGSQRHGNRA